MRRSRDEWMGRHDSVRRQCADAEAQGDALRVELVAERDRAQRLYAYGQREEQLTLQARAESDKLRAAVASLTAAWDALPPTVEALQAAACDLLTAMCAVGRASRPAGA